MRSDVTKDSRGIRSIAIPNSGRSYSLQGSLGGVEKLARDTTQHSYRSRNHSETIQDPLEIHKVFRRRSVSSKSNSSGINDIVVVDVPEIRSCDSSASDTSASTLATSAPISFDIDTEALHKVYYSQNIHGPSERNEQRTATAKSAKEIPSQSYVHPQKEVMKRHRRDKTATLGMVGAGVGTLILPVIGTVVGGVITGYATNKSLKRYEKKIQRKWERDQFQKDASSSQVARHAVFV